MKIERYLNETLLFGVMRYSNRLTDKLSAYYQSTGLNYPQSLVLIAIAQEKDPVRPRQLRAAFKLSSGAISQTITHLEKMKYLERQISQDDARGYCLKLTRSGRARANYFVSVIEALERRIESKLGSSNVQKCLRLLEQAHDVVSASKE